MLIRSRTLTGLLFITLAGTSAAGAAPLTSSTHQTEQDKARQEALAPQQQDFQSSQQRVAPQGIPFPEETHCKLINRVDIDSDNQALTRKLLAKTARQAQGRCLGSEGIRLLAYTLQNELIAQGYITSLIDVPSQSLEHGILRFTLHYGKVGAIDYADGSDTTRLWNSLPTSSGTILRLSDLEQGMANLQRLPGATAHMKLLPGQHEGESDIQIARSLAKKWQLGAWLDDAGSKASGRYQAGGALYLYDLTTLQRDANRLLGYTAQQTLDYLQSLYEKKLCTYPRTDSRYLTDDKEGGVNALALCCAGICGTEPPAAVCSGQVCSSKKVSDHHAVVPTIAAGETDLETLLTGEREILRLVSRQVLMAVSAPFVCLETEVKLDCGGNAFAAKGKTILHMGWRAYTEKGKQDNTLPELSEGQSLPVSSCAVKEGRTTPPRHFTEAICCERGIRNRP